MEKLGMCTDFVDLWLYKSTLYATLSTCHREGEKGGWWFG